MGGAARKARKRAGIPFTKPQKVPTPVEDRTATKKAASTLVARTIRDLRRQGHRDLTPEQVTEAAVKKHKEQKR